ncbi:odorant receptor 10a-like [Vespa crabro]|uniref:odorant receptor 10a-like n=1 Tax=Vespa crabro TaxID=7445 RepID=UPI001F012C12|nr:odorant receptor 10a-like [Vespa crabro]
MGFILIIDNISDMEYVLACFEENLFNIMTLLKICICRMNRNGLAEILKEVKVDLIPERYKTDEEKIAFLNYNNFSLMIVRITLGSGTTASIMYYLSATATNIERVIANSSYGYVLPYKTHPLIEPTNLTIYILLCLYQFIIVLSLIFGYVAIDCLFISIGLHVSGVFSALSCKVKHVLNNQENRKRRIKELILRHIRLVRLADSLESVFNVLIFQQLIGSTIHLTLLGYDSLLSITLGEEKKLFAFVFIACRVLISLLIYCYIGECLINESTSFGESIYHCKWYNISQEEIKLMQICMMRSSKQMQLTVGKFFVLSLTTFTDIKLFEIVIVFLLHERYIAIGDVWPLRNSVYRFVRYNGRPLSYARESFGNLSAETCIRYTILTCGTNPSHHEIMAKRHLTSLLLSLLVNLSVDLEEYIRPFKV